ncbi:trophoblast glycoprotein-like [Alligator mississippiensis]|uniref:trophoblast glycoprotein-like n=1 Tax=Alligator mississippiensis TaxID=8496 RepID=UPI0028775AB3|nr:trophoblast glycoprotein-like [Alligator mississippiensis]
MAGPRVLVLALALALGPGPGPARGCPPPCYCFATPELAQCHYTRLQQPPAGLPRAVHNLTVLGARLPALRPGAFAGNASAALRDLQLRADGIERIEDGAFAGLPALRALDLSRNPLRALAPGAFAGLPRLRALRLNQALPLLPAEQLGAALRNLSGLRRLEIAGNALRALPAAALPAGLEELDARNNSLAALGEEELARLREPGLARLRLLLARNPLRCDCALRPLLAWARNASARLPDAGSWRCAEPPALAGAPALRLRAPQLGCAGPAEPPELETASYVFFGIVLALIGLVFLMVLYLNRRGIKRWLRNLREACRDQMEGYHYRYEQDAEPRRASPATAAGS